MLFSKLHQPPILKLATLTTLCERFGFYILNYMLVLYSKAEYHFSDSEAFSLFAVLTALAYMLPAFGGYLADNIIGIRRSLIMGLAIEGAGLCLLAIPNHFFFPISLALIVVGTGLFKTAPTNLLGHAYKEKDAQIDSGFTIYYMGFNIGSLLASILCGIIARYFGWHVAFLVGGIGILSGLLIYFLYRETAANLDAPIGTIKLLPKIWGTIGALIALAVLVCSFLLAHTTINNILFTLVGLLLCSYYAYEMFKASSQDRMKIVACLILIFIGIVYFIFYFQSFTSIALFIERVTNRNFLNFNIPTEVYLGLGPIWVIIFGPILAFTYKLIAAKKGQDLPITIKFGIGLLVIGISFFSLVLGIHFSNANEQVSAVWIIITFSLITLGEMLVSALGVAMVTHLVPKRMYGITMGTWFFGMSLAGLTSGWFASLASVSDAVTDPQKILSIYNSAFVKFGISGIIIAIVVFFAGPMINKIGDLRGQ